MDVRRARLRLEAERTETSEREPELICEACGKPIDEARLLAKPWARLRIVDQVRAEHALSHH